MDLVSLYSKLTAGVLPSAEQLAQDLAVTWERARSCSVPAVQIKQEPLADSNKVLLSNVKKIADWFEAKTKHASGDESMDLLDGTTEAPEKQRQLEAEHKRKREAGTSDEQRQPKRQKLDGDTGRTERRVPIEASLAQIKDEILRLEEESEQLRTSLREKERQLLETKRQADKQRRKKEHYKHQAQQTARQLQEVERKARKLVALLTGRAAVVEDSTATTLLIDDVIRVLKSPSGAE